MLDTALQSYLIQAKAAGLPIDTVVAELVKMGWSKEHVLEAQAWYVGKPDSQPVVATPPVTAQPSALHHKETKKFGWKAISALIILVVGLILSGTGVYAYLLAADKVSVNNQRIEEIADTIALTVPFFPKTPKIVLQRAMLSHLDVTQSSMDFSMVITSNDFQDLVNMNALDISVKGYTDITDTKNPRFSFTGFVTKDFNFEVRKNSPIIYFRMLKVPVLLTSMIGIDHDKFTSIVQNWVSYDTTPLDTQARRNLEQLDTRSQLKNDAMGSVAEKLLHENILSALVMNKEMRDGVSTYKINFQPSPFLLDRLGETLDNQLSSTSPHYQQVLGASTYYLTEQPKLSDMIKNFEISMWIDDKDFYVRETSFSFNVEASQINEGVNTSPSMQMLPLPTTQTSPMTVVGVLKMSDFGKTIAIETPATSITMEEFTQQLTTLLYGDKTFELEPELEP